MPLACAPYGLRALAALLAVCISAATAAFPTAAQVGQPTVNLYDNVFVPPEVVVPAGGTVVWTNNGNLHNVVAVDRGFDSALIPHRGSWARTFAEPGRYRYQCTLHAGMNGTVLVLAPGQAPPAPPPAASGPPRLRIVAPADGATLLSGDVPLRLQTENFTLGTSGVGHVVVNGARLQLVVSDEALLLALPPGRQVIEAQLRAPDLGRLEGTAPARVTVEVRQQSEPTSDRAGPLSVLAFWPVALALLGLVVVWRRR